MSAKDMLIAVALAGRVSLALPREDSSRWVTRPARVDSYAGIGDKTRRRTHRKRQSAPPTAARDGTAVIWRQRLPRNLAGSHRRRSRDLRSGAAALLPIEARDAARDPRALRDRGRRGGQTGHREQQ